MIIFISINDCRAADFDDKVSVANYEMLKFTVTYIIISDAIRLCLSTLLVASQKVFDGNVKLLNTNIKNFAKNIKDIQSTKTYIKLGHVIK